MYINELHFKQLEQKTALIMSMSNGKILAYESIESFPSLRKEKFRFKIIQSQNLMRKITDWTDSEFIISE